jgi:hypothetical protein
LFIAAIVAKVGAINSTYESISYNEAYGERTVCTAYKCELVSTKQADVSFVMFFEGPLAFDSKEGSDAGPFVLMRNGDYIENYNMRYGAASSKDFHHQTQKQTIGLIYFVDVAFLLIIGVQWIIVLLICKTLRRQRQADPSPLEQSSVYEE